MVSKKTALATVDGTPKKRMFLSIISDYDLKTGVCELIDNALDLWVSNGRHQQLSIAVDLEIGRQIIKVADDAGGVSEKDAELLVSPGASLNDVGDPLIGVFGVGGKRAAVALGEHVEIRTRKQKGKSIQIDLTSDWIASPDWDLEIYEIPDLPVGTTTIEISKVRQSFEDVDVEQLRLHLGETYSGLPPRKWSII